MVVRATFWIILFSVICGAVASCDREDDGSVKCVVSTLQQDVPLNVTHPGRVRQLHVKCSDRTHLHEVLDVTALLPFSGLRSLSIHGCLLGRAGPGTFRHFPSLSALSVRTSGDEGEDNASGELELQPGVFDGVEKLESLDLSGNGLRLLQPGLLARLTTLKALNFTDNRLRELSELSMAGVSDSLQVLDISRNNLLELPPAAVGFLPLLRQLHAAGNRLRLVRDGALLGLEKLELLDLANNQLVALPAMLLNETRRLRELQLQNNAISVLPPGLLAHLPHLLSVNMSANRLSSLWIRGDALAGLHRLIVLDMAGNRLQSLSQDVFSDLSSLQVLDLSGNQLQSLPAGLLAPLSNLHTLALQGNLISRVERRSLSGLHVLSRLNLADNRLTFIDMEAFAECTGVRELQLQGNQLLRVPPALALLRQLQQLDLANNFIANIETEALTPLEELSFLRLARNQLVNISEQLLTAQAGLTMLDLSGNRLSKIEGGAFDRCRDLQAIRLDANRLSNINGLLAKLPRLLWLNASDNMIEFFDYALIPAELRWLDLHNNKLREIENFYNIESKIKLETLDLSHNEISRISKSSVPDSIKYFIMAGNRLSTVDPGTFEAKYQLMRLDLSTNQLSELDLTAIALPSLEDEKAHKAELMLAGNPFFCGCRMDWLHTINTVLPRSKYPKVLDLDRVMCRLLHAPNRLTPLPVSKPEDFLCTYQRHCFALCHCCNYVACDCEMKCPSGCSCYHDHTWNTNIVDCSRRERVAISREIPMDATAVFADGNNIRSLDSHTFIGRKRVRFLYVNNSNVEVIQNRSLNGLSTLQVLRLDNNLLAEVHHFEFEGLQSLRELYLHNNRLVRIHPGAFSKLRSLEVLTLKNNNLVSFPAWQLTANPYLVQVQLSGNPWSCGCSYQSRMSSYLSENSAKIEDVKDVTCVKGQVSQCTSLDVAESAGAPPRSETTLPLVLAVAGLLAVAAVVGCILLRYKTINCARRKRCPTASTTTGGSSAYTETTGISIVTPEAGKIYDVFVTYSAQDTRFVNEVLSPQLEVPSPPYRLCLLRRDAPNTGFLRDAVLHCVQSSRRTLMVLSRNFLDNEWCRFDFKRAHLEALRHSSSLLVLLLGVDRSAIEGPLSTLLKTAEVLQYGEPELWQQLRALMPPQEQLTLPRSVSDQAYLLRACYDKRLLQKVLQNDSPTPTCSTSVSEYQGGSGSTQARSESTTTPATNGSRLPADGTYSSLPPSEHTYMTIDQHAYHSVGRAIAGDELYTTLEPEAGASDSSQLRELRLAVISPEDQHGYLKPLNSYPEHTPRGVVCLHRNHRGCESCVPNRNIRREPDGCFVPSVVDVAHDRHQRSTVSCPEQSHQGHAKSPVSCVDSAHQRSASHSLWV